MNASNRTFLRMGRLLLAGLGKKNSLEKDQIWRELHGRRTKGVVSHETGSVVLAL